MPSLEVVISWLILYRYQVLLPMVVVEGPIVTVLAGFFASLGKLNFLLAYLVVILGEIGGDIFVYAIGRFGGKRFINNWGSWLGIPPEAVNHLKGHFDRHAGKTLIIGKISHLFGAPILAAAGIAEYPFNKFVWFDFIATLPKSLALMIIGFYFGQAYSKIDKIFNYAAFATIGLIVIIMIVYFLIPRIAKKYFKKYEV